MNERSIAYSAPLVPRVLDGSKTQTRRGLTIPAGWQVGKLGIITSKHPRQGKFGLFISRTTSGLIETDLIPCPYGKLGELLYVKEDYYQFGHWEPMEGVQTKGGNQKWKFVPDSEDILFDRPGVYRKSPHRTDYQLPCWYKRLGRFMPRKYSRIILEITDIRVERLNEISEADAIAEGIQQYKGPLRWMRYLDAVTGEANFNSARDAFVSLWESINGFGSWDANPWVWAISFKRVTP